MKEKFKQEIERTMNSLDDLTSVRTDPYFYTRLKARMEDESSASMSWKWGLATTLLVVLLNILVVSNLSIDEGSDAEIMDALAVEYSSSWPSLDANDNTYENE